MNEIDIEVGDLISALNAQIASYNLDLQIAKLQIATLQKRLDEMQKTHTGKSSAN